MARNSNHTLSKSRFIRGLQCHKSLWLHTRKPELLEESPEAQAIFRQGHVVGDLARELFPGGTLIPYDGMTHDEQIAMTRKALKTAKVIYEAAFCHNGVFVKADILHRTASGWNLYEVKSSTEVKDIYLDDVAVQHHVITGSGVPLNKAFVVHINNAYVRDGDLDLEELFVKSAVKSDIKARQADVIHEIDRQKKVLARRTCPKIDIGPHCSDPYECDFAGHCWQHIPENSIFDLAGRGVDKFQLYREGIVRIEDVPLDRLKAQQLQQAELAHNKGTVVGKKGLKEFLDSLWYPLCFLDFETFIEAVPSYDGQRPYQQIPFQYSLHCQTRKGGKVKHSEFLAEPNVNPRKALLKQLLHDIPDDACILAYHKSFEIGRLKELAEQFPKYRKKIENMIDRTVDLIVPFRQRHLYSWKQKGSHSIKAVLPAFVPEMSYDGLEIADGGAAMEAYHMMCAVADNPVELAKIRMALLKYCRQDTLAMVKLLKVIEEKVGGK